MGWQDDPVVGGKPRWESDPILTPAASASAADAPALVIRPGEGAPTLLAPSSNPYSAGRYPLGRIYTVGDHATFRETDILTDVEIRTFTQRITLVDTAADRVEFNGGRGVMDLMGNIIRTGKAEYDAPVQFTPAEFQVGKKWTAAFVVTKRGEPSKAYYDLSITRREKVGVPAGEFDAFRIEGQGWNITRGARLELVLWLVPGLNFPVKREWVTHNPKGRFKNTERWELVSLRQQAIGG